MNIFVMALEPLDTRYTGQWYEGLPTLIRQTAQERGIEVAVHNVAGEQTSSEPTEGAFLDFFATNIWKNSQVNSLVRCFQKGMVRAGDKILFTDAWHTGVTQVRYMSELMKIPVEIHSMWHAGSYDPQDFLGRLIEDKRWTFNTERGLFYASHVNYFATEFHRELFLNTLLPARGTAEERCVISGQPHAALIEALAPFKGMKKERLVIFPHRIAPEKQPEIFRDLAEQLPDIEFVVCQDKKLSKDEYHNLLGRALIVFSANLQETLGISAMEAMLVDTIPLLPDRLSYSEMYDPQYLYPSEWTESWEAYMTHRDELVKRIKDIVDRYDPKTPHDMTHGRQRLLDNYLTCKPMLDRLLGN